jgi:hypothetical protein
MIEKARHAFSDYVVWAYATPKASLKDRLAQELYQAQQHRLDSEGKAYLSVLVNEFNRPGVSGKEDAR